MTVFCEKVGKEIPPCPDDCRAPNIFYCIVNTKPKENQSSTSKVKKVKNGE